ncbi:MAG: beta-hydroxyacyl-ACP dehydratase [Planctomycetia bacterium]|nr:beta-hydroxyacyl-ACP dehydratase [Planctomycetia bacterium]
MTLDRILAAIPHRPPFLLVDEVVEQDERRIVCRKKFTGEEFWYAGHYPGFPLTPGVILCEAAMQAGAILLSTFIKEGEGMPVATLLDDVRFKRMVVPGETIEMEVTLDEHVSRAFYLTGKVTVEGKLAIRLRFGCTMARGIVKP